MAGTNDFLPFAVGVGANVVDQATWAAAAALLANGFQSGIAQSAYLNKAWRQSSTIAAAVAQFIADQSGDNVLDNGDVDTIVASLEQAVQQTSSTQPNRVVASSATLNLTLTDYSVGLNRTAAPTAMDVNLPAGAAVGQKFKITDLAGNFSTAAVRVVPPSGSIAGLGTFTLNEDRGGAIFELFDGGIWGVETF